MQPRNNGMEEKEEDEEEEEKELCARSAQGIV